MLIDPVVNITGNTVKRSEEPLVTTKHSQRESLMIEGKKIPLEQLPEIKTLTFSAAGDVTIGSDLSYGYENSFVHEAAKNGLHFFVENIKELFSNDDFTSVNLETPLTTSNQKAEKQFSFKGDPSYTEILSLGSIEAVNLANNHTYDYLQQGYDDTLHYLEKHHIGSFGNGRIYSTVIKDIKIGALGYKGWHDSKEIRNQIKEEIDDLKDEGVKVIIIHFHWGDERVYVPNHTQIALGRFAIDQGADLVVGHHPHVVQGIEEYNGKFIVYSLGNFMFGGNRNPSDKDSFVFQQTFYFSDGELTNQKEIHVIPFSISSVSNRNNFQPTPLKGPEGKRVFDKIVDLSSRITSPTWVQYDISNYVSSN